MNNTPTLTPTAEQLLKAAEFLLATKGLGAVSTREIARQAGQKNHSALNYHFGSRDALIEAILDYRMTPLNQRRQQRLDTLRDQGREPNLRGLVEIMVEPFANELLCAPEDSYYLSLIAQLLSHRQWLPLFTQHKQRTSAVMDVGNQIVTLLQQSHSDAIAFERVRLMGLHVLNTITDWDAMRRRDELTLDHQSLQWRIDNFVNYLVGGLTAAS